MREHARSQTAILLRRFAYQATRTARSGDADSIHDLRVAMRRLSRCLHTFSQFYPHGTWKKIRRQMSLLMDQAGAVRDRDIMLELLDGAGISKRAAVVKHLEAERQKAAAELMHGIRRWKNRNMSQKW